MKVGDYVSFDAFQMRTHKCIIIEEVKRDNHKHYTVSTGKQTFESRWGRPNPRARVCPFLTFS